ncbi:MAG: hypothetical protein Q4G60_02745 [bacterium]|nr:hypothetical protein [bacterium]
MDKEPNHDIQKQFTDENFTEDISLGQFAEELLKLDETQRQELVQYAKKLQNKS